MVIEPEASSGIVVEYPTWIDIMPASDTECINNDGKSVIPVTIFSNPNINFDATQIDPVSVKLEGMEIKAVGKANKYLSHFEDVNRDGYEDLVVQIQDEDGMLEEGTVLATVSGNLFDGTIFSGEELICIKSTN